VQEAEPPAPLFHSKDIGTLFDDEIQ
jgi:hypothetical protein